MISQVFQLTFRQMNISGVWPRWVEGWSSKRIKWVHVTRVRVLTKIYRAISKQLLAPFSIVRQSWGVRGPASFSRRVRGEEIWIVPFLVFCSVHADLATRKRAQIAAKVWNWPDSWNLSSTLIRSHLDGISLPWRRDTPTFTAHALNATSTIM